MFLAHDLSLLPTRSSVCDGAGRRRHRADATCLTLSQVHLLPVFLPVLS